MNKVPIVKPGDKAIVYLNTYHTNFSREKAWDRSEGDFLWLPENLEYQSGDESIPTGLIVRTSQEVQNIGSRLIYEALEGGYEFSDAVVGCDNNLNLEDAFDRLDAGEAQILLTYANMLPKRFLVNSLPSAELLTRARKNHWRIGLIFLFVDPFSNLILWNSTYTHFGKGDDLEGVLVTITDSSIEKMLEEPPPTGGDSTPATPLRRKGLFGRKN